MTGTSTNAQNPPRVSSSANAYALQAADQTFSVELNGRKYSQQPQKYHARSSGVLKARYAAISDTAALDPILEGAE